MDTCGVNQSRSRGQLHNSLQIMLRVKLALLAEISLAAFFVLVRHLLLECILEQDVDHAQIYLLMHATASYEYLFMLCKTVPGAIASNHHLHELPSSCTTHLPLFMHLLGHIQPATFLSLADPPENSIIFRKHICGDLPEQSWMHSMHA